MSRTEKYQMAPKGNKRWAAGYEKQLHVEKKRRGRRGPPFSQWTLSPCRPWWHLLKPSGGWSSAARHDSSIKTPPDILLPFTSVLPPTQPVFISVPPSQRKLFLLYAKLGKTGTRGRRRGSYCLTIHSAQHHKNKKQWKIAAVLSYVLHDGGRDLFS